MRTYLIELRADFQEDEKYDILLSAVREAARTMLATALLMKDKREPTIALQTGDMFETNKDLDVMEGAESPGE